MTAIAAAGLVASLGSTAIAAGPTNLAKGMKTPDRITVPAGLVAKLPGNLNGATGKVAVFVRLTTKGAADAFSATLPKGKKAAKAAAIAARAATNQTATAVFADLKGRDKAARQLWRTTNAIPGLAVVADAGKLRQLVARADVVSISRIVPKTIDNAHAEVLTNVLATWQNTGLFGDGVRVGIIDSGIDYTQADFGGAGTSAAYDAIDRTAPNAAFPSAKVVGGTDLAGENYNANSAIPAQFIPQPDPNPLDCDNHGSHVAGTAAGFGINADGTTFSGDYSALTAGDLAAMRVGPGMAPKALLYAIKVFGCPTGAAGSTSLVAPGIDWALDPNGDGDMSDHLDLVNISIGGNFGSPDDPESAFVQNATEHNMLTVIAAGNAGDIYDAAGSPGNTPAALTVASSQDSFNLLDAAEVTAPADVAGRVPGQYSVAFDYDGLDLTKPVVKMTQATNADGCAPFNAADKALVAGKFVWLEWNDNDAVRRCGSAGRSANAVAAGAAGAIFSDSLTHFSAGITGSAVIPVFQLTGPATTSLRPALNAGTLTIRLAGDLRQVFGLVDPAIVDAISGFSSRGTRSPGVKPDVTAPGDTIVSDARGTGNKALVESGTSMATPHVAGIAALVRQAHPSWTAAEVKAAIMDTANHDLYSKPNQTSPIYAPNRVGTGRVDALGATGTLVLAGVADSTATVSVGFGVVEVSAAHVTLSKTITVVNKGASSASFNVHYTPITTMPGVSYSLDRSSVTVAGHGSATVKVTIDIERDDLAKTIDPTVAKTQIAFGLNLPRDFVADASGRVDFSPTSGATVPLRVSVYAAPKPVAAITVPSMVNVPKNGSNFLGLGGRGVLQGSGDQTYASLVSVLELGATSPQLKDCKKHQVSGCAINETARGGDIRYVGAASNAVAMKAAGDAADSMVVFGFAMWSNWYNVGSNTIPFVDIDVNGDGNPDFETFVLKPAATDLLLAETVDFNTGDIVDLEFINTVTADLDTNVFDSNVILLPVFLSTMGIDPTQASHRISYQAGVAGFYAAPADGSLIDSTGVASYDVLRPGLWAEGGDPGVLFLASPGTGFVIHENAASQKLDKSDSLLVLNFHNGSSTRAQLVKVVGS